VLYRDPPRQTAAERWQERSIDAGDFWTLARGGQELVDVRGKVRNIVTAPILEHKRETAGSADAGDGRRRKADGRPLWKFAQLLIKALLYGLQFLASRAAVRPRLQGDKKECVIARLNVTEQTESNDAGCVLHARHLSEYIFYLERSLVRALERSRIRELKIHIEIALILVRQETGRQLRAKERGGHPEEQQSSHGHSALANQRPADIDVAVGSAPKNVIEPLEELAQRSCTGFLGPKQERC
jgi:hypothetical protein